MTELEDKSAQAGHYSIYRISPGIVPSVDHITHVFLCLPVSE